MRAAIQTSIHLSYSKDDYEPLNCYDVFYLATLGGANGKNRDTYQFMCVFIFFVLALALGDVVGNFQTGKQFDALIIDMDVTNSTADYLHDCSAIDLLQKFIFLGDDRNIISVYVAGDRVK